MNTHDVTNDRTYISDSIDIGGALHDLEKLGRLWAHYGLTLGRLAVQTSAETLSGTARMLGRLAASFEETGSSKDSTPDANHS